MSELDTVATVCGAVALAAPLVLVIILGVPALLGAPLSERATDHARGARTTAAVRAKAVSDARPAPPSRSSAATAIPPAAVSATPRRLIPARR